MVAITSTNQTISTEGLSSFHEVLIVKKLAAVCTCWLHSTITVHRIRSRKVDSVGNLEFSQVLSERASAQNLVARRDCDTTFAMVFLIACAFLPIPKTSPGEAMTPEALNQSGYR
ncbi:MAG: hypothetical protein M1812_006041 [Candelaria pacifica]|nr:MAG: hypothetical protein M1812_006041 [Candelaria pacifica]